MWMDMHRACSATGSVMMLRNSPGRHAPPEALAMCTSFQDRPTSPRYCADHALPEMNAAAEELRLQTPARKTP